MSRSTASLTPVQQGSPSRTLPEPTSDRARFNRVGLVNQGATCYLNSLLQVLYHLPYFRSAVYRCVGDASGAAASTTATNAASGSDDGNTTSNSNTNNSPATGNGGASPSATAIPAALQELFFQLQECNHAPKTETLTHSFGWSEQEVLQQHDIHELLTLLRDELENKMKGTPSQNAINRLFEGKVENVIATLDGSYVSRRPEAFFDIQLEVAGQRSVMTSLATLVKKDQLTGDNRYKVEEEGKPPVFKDAEKGLTYVKFPPVLCFHLQRFEMDLMSPNLDMRKINDRFEFTQTLDLRAMEKGEGGDTNCCTPPPASSSPVGDTTASGINDTPPPPPVVPAKESTTNDANDGSNDNPATAAAPSSLSSTNAAAAVGSPTNDDFAHHVPAIYDLHSVIVHKGSVNNGHYYCYVREVLPLGSTTTSEPPFPQGAAAAGGDSTIAAASGASATSNALSSSSSPSDGGKTNANNNDLLDFNGGVWYQFDDDHVYNVTQAEAVQGNFGGGSTAGRGGGAYGSLAGNHNAYMLTYIRRGYWETIMRPTPTDHIPQRVKDEFRRVMTEEDARRRELLEEGRRCYVNVVDDSHIFEHVRRHGVDLYSMTNRGDSEFSLVPGATDSRASRMARHQTIVLRRDDSFASLYDKLQEVCGYDKNNIRLRTWEYHIENPRPLSYRPARALASFDDAQGTVEAVLADAGVAEAVGATTTGSAASSVSAMGGSTASATSRGNATTTKPLKVLLYVEQKRVIPLAPAPPASLAAFAALSTPAASDDNTVLGATSATNATNNGHHDGSYSMNLLASDGDLIEDAAASSQTEATVNTPPRFFAQNFRAISFMPRDPRPTLTLCFNKSRILKALVVRLGVPKGAAVCTYTIVAEAFTSVDQFRASQASYRFAPQTYRLPNSGKSGNATVEYGFTFTLTGDYSKYPHIRTEAIRVINIVATPNIQHTPTLLMTVHAIYADEEAEVAALYHYQQRELKRAANAAATTTIAAAGGKRETNAATPSSSSAPAALITLDRTPTLSPPILPPLPKDLARACLLLLKGYTPSPSNGEHIRYLGCLVVDEKEPLLAYGDVMLAMMGIPVERIPLKERLALCDGLRFYDEVKPSEIVPLEPLRPIAHQGLLSGNVIIIEMSPHRHSSLLRLPTLMSYWIQSRSKLFINIRLRTDPIEPLFQCQMDLRWSYHQVCECIAARAAQYLTTTSGATPAHSLGASPNSPLRDKLNASLASTAISTATRTHNNGSLPIIDADKIVLYTAADVYTSNMAAADPIKCTSSEGASLESILYSVPGSRYMASDLFFDVGSLPRLQMEQQVQLRAVIADQFGEVYTDEVLVTLPPGSTPPDLAKEIVAAAQRAPKVRDNAEFVAAIRALGASSEAFCLVGTKDNRVVSFVDNILLNLGESDSEEEEDEAMMSSSSSSGDEEEETDSSLDSDGSSSSSSSSGQDGKKIRQRKATTRKNKNKNKTKAPNDEDADNDNAAATTAATKKNGKRKRSFKRLVRQFPDNLKPLDPSAFTKDVVYQLRPIEPLPHSGIRLYVGFCDCPLMQYTHQAPLFNTPIVVTINATMTLTDVWQLLKKMNPELVKDAREEPQKSDGLCIKLVMYTDQALSFNEWDHTPVNNYFIHTKHKSIYKPMLCINRSRPKEFKGPRYGSGAEPKLRLGSGGAAVAPVEKK